MSNDITPTERHLPASPSLDLTGAIEAAAALGKEGVDVLERLHALQAEERRYGAKTAFVRAMAKLRGELPPIIKSVTGQHGAKRDGTRTKGMYAPLDTITPILDPIAAANGFSYRFDREVVAGREDDYMVCIVTHEEGHEERTKYPCPSGEGNRGTNRLQAIAVGESYAKRYALVAAFGITTADPDDDAQSWQQQSQEFDTITDEQAMELEAAAESLSKDDWGKLLKWARVDAITDLPANKYADVMAAIRRKAAQ